MARTGCPRVATFRPESPDGGELSLDSKEVALHIRLGFLLFALKPRIEREAQRFFDENFPL